MSTSVNTPSLDTACNVFQGDGPIVAHAHFSQPTGQFMHRSIRRERRQKHRDTDEDSCELRHPTAG
jgi:hypothetical protein